MFKWGKREKQHFFKPTLCIRDKQKLAQGQKKPPKNSKNICKIILNTPKCSWQESPQLHRGPEPPHWILHIPGGRQNWPATTQSCQSVPKHSMGTVPPLASPRLCGRLPSKWRALKKPQNPHLWDLVMSLGFGNQANEKARAKISNFCLIPGKAHCYQ